jgi:hypothetical protein
MRSDPGPVLARLDGLRANEPQILKPFYHPESCTIEQAREIIGPDNASLPTIRTWVNRFGLGRRVMGKWIVSRVALLMHLENDRAALHAYHRGDRSSPLVAPYFRRCGVDLSVYQTGEAA